MKQIKDIIIYVMVVLIFLLSSCSRDISDNRGGLYTGERLTMRAFIPNSKTGGGDGHIETVRVIVFSNAGELILNKIVANTPTADGVEVELEVARGINNFYVICNENEELKFKLTGFTREDEVEQIAFQAGGITSPIPMYGNVMQARVSADADGSNVQVVVGGVLSNSLTIKVDRLLAKLNMTVIKNVPDPNADFKVEKLSIQICRAPKYTTLKPGLPYTDTQWAGNLSYTGTGTLTNNGSYVKIAEMNTIPAGIDNIKFPDIYLPEHLLVKEENEAEATYLLVDMVYRMNKGNTAEMHTSYTVPIGQAPPVNHNITRNHHYDIYATIKGLGAMGIYAEILPFTEYHHPVEWQPFEGYMIVSEKESEYNKNTNIWNDYSQYSGILKIIKNSTVSPALFRYGSLIALADGASAGAFNAMTDVLWSGNYTAPTTWDGVSYQASGDIEHTPASVAQGKGDPCRLVGITAAEINNGEIDNNLWRMPTAIEMEWLNTARTNEIKQNGFYSFASLLTPKNGYRTIEGIMTPAITEGRYWSSAGANSFIFNTLTNTKISSALDDPKQAYGVRCIRTDGYRHTSRFAINGLDIEWTGGTNLKARITDNFLVPYWILTPVPATDITYSVLQGGSDVSAAVFSVTQLPEPYVGRTFQAKATGYGLDGVVHEYDIEIRQKSLQHNISLALISPSLPEVNGSLRIPQAGATLKVNMGISPSPFPPYDTAYSTLQWKTSGYWYTNKANYNSGTTVTTSGTSEITIPPNTAGHIIAVEVSFSWVSPEGSYPPTNPTGKIRFIQEQ